MAPYQPLITNPKPDADRIALRIHPVVPANTREAVRDTCLPYGGGEDGQAPLFVKAGTQVLYSVYSMHRRKDLFGEDVETFRPERWDQIQPKWVCIQIQFLSHLSHTNLNRNFYHSMEGQEFV